MPIPTPAAALSETFLRTVDDAAPGLVEGLYLVGSVALDDFHDGASDVDFVAVTARRPDADGLAALAAAHTAVRAAYPRPAFEGTHLTWADLAGAPDDCADAPDSFAGEFHPASRFALSPVTWHELATAGVAVRGPQSSTVDVWTDWPALHAFTVDNLTSYWRGWHATYSAAPETTPEQVTWAACWAVLGVSRLHRQMSFGGLATKCDGGGHALSAFGGRWHPLVVDALGIRAGHPSRYGPAEVLRRDTLDFLDMAVESGLALG
ncbi:MAG TPA: hypothetical protein VGN37_17455 [Actinocatenispora sp.]